MNHQGILKFKRKASKRKNLDPFPTMGSQPDRLRKLRREPSVRSGRLLPYGYIVLFSVCFRLCSAATAVQGGSAKGFALRTPATLAEDLRRERQSMVQFAKDCTEQKSFRSVEVDAAPSSPTVVNSPQLRSATYKSDQGSQGNTSDVDVNVFKGPSVEFTWKPTKQGYRKVTMCGSWTGWKEHYVLEKCIDSDALKVVVNDIPSGFHQFKVSMLVLIPSLFSGANGQYRIVSTFS